MVIAQRSGGRFFGRRVNCEQVPLLPAWAVAEVFDDPRETPHLLVWKDSAGTVQERVRIYASDEIPMKPMLVMWGLDIAPHNSTGEVEIQRDDGTTDIIRTLLRPLPRNGGSVRLLICPDCLTPRRGLYGWEPDEDGRFTSSVVRSNWRCRACNKLCYASEGGALVVRGAIARFESSIGRSRPVRPEPWYPEIIDVTEVPGQGR